MYISPNSSLTSLKEESLTEKENGVLSIHPNADRQSWKSEFLNLKKLEFGEQLSCFQRNKVAYSLHNQMTRINVCVITLMLAIIYPLHINPCLNNTIGSEDHQKSLFTWSLSQGDIIICHAAVVYESKLNCSKHPRDLLLTLEFFIFCKVGKQISF